MPKSQLDHPPFTLYPKQGRMIGPILFLLILGIFGFLLALAILNRPGGFGEADLRAKVTMIAGFVAPPFILVALVMYVRTMLNPKPILEVGESGWTSRAYGVEVHVPWSEVQRVTVTRLGFGDFIGVVPRDVERLAAGLDPKAAKLIRNNMHTLKAIAAVPESFLPIRAADLGNRLAPYVASRMAQ